MDFPFHFDNAALPASPVKHAEVRAGIKTKAELLDEVARALRFPDYFGGNWDAFEECIRDLSWLPAGTVVLRHHDLPLAEDDAELKTYLSILSDAVEKWSTQQRCYLVVVFPASMRDRVDWLCRLAARDA